MMLSILTEVKGLVFSKTYICTVFCPVVGAYRMPSKSGMSAVTALPWGVIVEHARAVRVRQ